MVLWTATVQHQNPNKTETPNSIRALKLVLSFQSNPNLRRRYSQVQKQIDEQTPPPMDGEDAFMKGNSSETSDLPEPTSAHASPCPSGELRCVDGRCITLAQLCDGNVDCSDHADEDNCFTWWKRFGSEMYKCVNVVANKIRLSLEILDRARASVDCHMNDVLSMFLISIPKKKRYTFFLSRL